LKSNRTYLISFVGLKIGFHDFEYEINDAFFEQFEYSIIHKGDVKVHLRLEKKETMFIAQYQADGFVTTTCDRCTDELKLPVKGEFQIVYKFGNDISEDENLIVLPEEAYQLDVSEAIYELITISLPAKKVHPKGECNEEMLNLINKYSVGADFDSDDFNEDWDDEDEDWDEEDDDEWEDDEDEDEEGDNDDNNGDKPIDPRWSILKNLN
jgi:uncharacterized metal-binding protein YceD (DUF177 family)